MLSAKEMVKLADSSIQNEHVAHIETIVKRHAENGKFFAKLWTGKPNSMDTQLIFIEQYNVDAYNHIQRMGYVFTSMQKPNGEVSLYIGWGFASEVALKIAIKAEAEEQ